PRAHDVRVSEPLEHGERMTGQSEGWPAGSGPVRRRHTDVPSANPGGRSRILSTGMCSGRVRGVAFSLVTFSWPHKRKSPAPPGGARKKTGTSLVGQRVKHWHASACNAHDQANRARRYATFARCVR